MNESLMDLLARAAKGDTAAAARFWEVRAVYIRARESFEESTRRAAWRQLRAMK